MNTTEAAAGKWPLIFKHFGITGQINKHTECPICGKKNFRIDDKAGAGTWICTCGAGDGFKLIREVTGRDFKSVADEIDRILGNDEREYVAPRRDYEAELVARWKTMSPVNNTNVQDYLRARGIYYLPKRGMKCSSGNMFCVATNDAGNPVITHTTHLEGDKKASIEVPKRTEKVDKERESVVSESIAIRFFVAQTCLGIAEGIETALSAYHLYECATWSTMNSGFMKKFRAPSGVEHLIIFADSDKNGAGHAAAFECAFANMNGRNDVKKVTVRWPEKGDFNDVLLESQEVFEWIFQ